MFYFPPMGGESDKSSQIYRYPLDNCYNLCYNIVESEDKMKKVPYFEMDKDYNVMVWNLHDWREQKYYSGKIGIARYMGFARGTSCGFMEAVFNVTFPDGDYKSLGQTELKFLDELEYVEI